MNNYKESHTFPSGLEVNYYCDLDRDYLKERNSISTQEDLVNFQAKWKYLFPSINNPNLLADRFVQVRESSEIQDSLARFADYNSTCEGYLNLMLPLELLTLKILAEKFMVTTGLVVMQIWNGGGYIEREDGTWIRKGENKC